MKRENVNRRDFNKLTVAAMGGMMAGSLVGCGGGDKSDPKTEKSKTGAEAAGKSGDGGGDKNTALAAWTDKHVCQGLNACEGKGQGGKNDCAGLGACFTANKHTCHTENECKYQGGCQDSVAKNDCAKKGECAVPLSEGSWKKAYEKFKADMATAGKADNLPAPPGPPKT